MIIVVGETANRPFERLYSFDELLKEGAFVLGPSRFRLMKLGIDLEKVPSLNLCSPGTWDPNVACLNARKTIEWAGLRPDNNEPVAILAMGQRCTFAFGLPWEPLLFKQVGADRGVNIICCAHPSGLSRWWNDQDNVRRFKEMIHGLA